MENFLVVAFIFLVTLILTGAIRRYALNKKLLDVPNNRSSHFIPTPRGGGIAFVVTFFISLLIGAFLGPHIQPFGLALMGGGIVAFVGFLDDKGHVSPLIRLIGHFTAGVWALYWLGGMPAIPFMGYLIPQSVFLTIVGLLYLVWLLNLYNFMDGIDGIAAVEVMTVCLGGAFLYWLNGTAQWMGLPLILAAAVGGFLVWNFPPARIFMGDVGSGFLGFVVGLFSLQAAAVTPTLFWGWVILSGVFIVDATITLLTRLLQGQKVYEAHRSHAYQHAAIKIGNHLQVTLSTMIINLFWLLPIAAFVVTSKLEGIVGLAIAYLPLIVLALKLKAGRQIV